MFLRPVPPRACKDRRSRAVGRTFIPIDGRGLGIWHIFSDLLDPGRATLLEAGGRSVDSGRGRGPDEARCCPTVTLSTVKRLLASNKLVRAVPWAMRPVSDVRHVHLFSDSKIDQLNVYR